jgi:hypothetical protein
MTPGPEAIWLCCAEWLLKLIDLLRSVWLLVLGYQNLSTGPLRILIPSYVEVWGYAFSLMWASSPSSCLGLYIAIAILLHLAARVRFAAILLLSSPDPKLHSAISTDRIQVVNPREPTSL